MVAAAEYKGVAVTVTPNGVPIYFQQEPKRLYKIFPGRFNHRGVTKEETDAELIFAAQAPVALGWLEVPSITEVLDVLHKPGLPWWGMKIGVDGVLTLHSSGQLREVMAQGRPALVQPDDDRGLLMGSVSTEQVVDMLTGAQLTVNHVRDRAGDRGLAVHDALQGWAETGQLPDPSLYGLTEKGYVAGLRAFLKQVDPEPLASEVMVCSREHGFAGRYDLRLRVKRPVEVVVRCGLKRGPVFRRLQPGEILTDLKSSKGVYDSHPRQLEGYEQASLESGYAPTVARGILHVTEDGEYEFVRSWATFDDFLAVLNVWRSNQEMKARKKGVTG